MKRFEMALAAVHVILSVAVIRLHYLEIIHDTAFFFVLLLFIAISYIAFLLCRYRKSLKFWAFRVILRIAPWCARHFSVIPWAQHFVRSRMQRRIYRKAYWKDKDQDQAKRAYPFYSIVVREEIPRLNLTVVDLAMGLELPVLDVEFMLGHLDVIPDLDHLNKISEALCLKVDSFKDRRSRLDNRLTRKRIDLYLKQNRLTLDAYLAAVYAPQDVLAYSLDIIERLGLTELPLVKRSQLASVLIKLQASFADASGRTFGIRDDMIVEVGRSLNLVKSSVGNPMDFGSSAAYVSHLEALDYFAKRLSRLFDPIFATDFMTQTACICNMVEPALPGGQYAEIDIYRTCCARALSRFLLQSDFQKAPTKSRRWVPATSAISYLARLTHSEKRLPVPNQAVLEISGRVFSKEPTSLEEFFINTFRSAAKLCQAKESI